MFLEPVPIILHTLLKIQHLVGWSPREQGRSAPRLRYSKGVQVGSKELLLSGHAEELPDFSVRPTHLRKRAGRNRAPGRKPGGHGQASSRPAYPYSPRGGRRQADPYRTRQLGRLQPRRYGFIGNRIRARPIFTRRGFCLPELT